MGSEDDFSSVSEAMEYFMPFKILGYHKVNERYSHPSFRSSCRSVSEAMEYLDSDSSSMWIFWSNNPDENSVAHCLFEERIRQVLIRISRRTSQYTVVQFWAVEREAGSKCILTTSHQPFAIKGLNKGYYSYRKKCMRRNINVGPEADEVQLGPAGRAFRSGSVEFSPDIKHYTIQEFPLRDHAILCQLHLLVSLPVFGLDSNNIVGVLELLSPYCETHWTHDLAPTLKEVGLTIKYNGSSESMPRENYSEGIADEVHKMFKEVAQTHPLALGLAFAPCRKNHCLNCSGIGCLDGPIVVYRDPHMKSLHEPYTERNGIGISGRAYASGKSFFCKDIRNFSILECPLVHHARLVGLTFSFATCLQSIQDENNNILVLEFLLLPGCYDIGNIKLFMGSLLTKMKNLFPHYIVVGEDFPVEELFPKAYDSLKYNEIGHVHGGDSPVSLPVTVTCSCEDPSNICDLDHEETVVDYFLPVNLSYEANQENLQLVLWRNNGEKYDGVDECIKHVFKHVSMEHYFVDLIQFWAARRIAGRSVLTTFDQPFCIKKGIRKVTCLYRIECMRRNICVDEEGNNEEQLGPAGRAFKNEVVESSPEVGLYTIQEFPLRDHAVLCDIHRAMFIPVFEDDGKGTVGVLEILSDSGWRMGTYLNHLTMKLEEQGLRIDYVHPQPGQSDSLAEIHKTFEAVSVRYPLHLARALTPCLNDYSQNNSSLRYKNHIWSSSRGEYAHDFLVDSSFHHLPAKTGVAGKALTSRRSCYGMNIGNWGIPDSPLSHYAKVLGCNFSVAIPVCVENTRLVGTPCVLEFFLLPGDYSNEHIGALLHSLWITVKQHLPPNFTILSEDVPGEPFFLEIGNFLENVPGSKTIVSELHGVAEEETNIFVPQENNSSIHIAHYQGNISGVHIVHGKEADTLVIEGDNMHEMHAVDGTMATSVLQRNNICDMHDVDGIRENPPIHQGENISEMHAAGGIEALVHQVANISSTLFEAGTRPFAEVEKNCSTRLSLSQMEGNKFRISLDELKLQFGNPLDEAAKNLGVSRTTLKGIRKRYGIHRWPAHKKNKFNPSLFMKQNLNDAPHIGSSEADSSHLNLSMKTPIHSSHVLQTNEHQAESYRDSEVDKIVTVKASYGHSAFIKFKLNVRSTLQDLQEQVTKRMKWEANRFEIKYQDEVNDWITIFIDEDLQHCLETSIDRGESAVSMSINLRLD